MAIKDLKIREGNVNIVVDIVDVMNLEAGTNYYGAVVLRRTKQKVLVHCCLGRFAAELGHGWGGSDSGTAHDHH